MDPVAAKRYKFAARREFSQRKKWKAAQVWDPCAKWDFSAAKRRVSMEMQALSSTLSKIQVVLMRGLDRLMKLKIMR